MSHAAVLWVDASRCAQAQRIFGLTTLERLRRSVAQLLPGAKLIVDSAAGPPGARLARALEEHGALVVLDGSAVIDPRLLRYLAQASGNLVARRGEGGQSVVALRLDADRAALIDRAAASLPDLARQLIVAQQAKPIDEESFPAYIDKLRRVLPYWLFRVDDPVARRAVERQLFLDNYKGSTDLLTAYVYPPLVWPAVRLCSLLRVHPNVVTILSVVLAFAAVPLFAHGQWLAGFACGYVMSVLDSVDGKLARLTFTDSALGNVLDHGLDLLHPPFWYWAWAQGLIVDGGSPQLATVAIVLNVIYVLDRIVLGVARRRLGHALHSSRPLDEYVRSFIARRNITMTLMALALLVGQGAIGLLLVTAWQGLTLAWHMWRTAWNGWLSPVRRA
jgi:phosphatidylglycerophosphate synthase